MISQEMMDDLRDKAFDSDPYYSGLLASVLGRFGLLEAIVKDLAADDIWDGIWGNCVYCDQTVERAQEPHDPECVYLRAVEAMKP
jgi:hypothetical protein